MNAVENQTTNYSRIIKISIVTTLTILVVSGLVWYFLLRNEVSNIEEILDDKTE